MANRSLRRAIQSLRQRVLEHQDKIADEQARLNPNIGLITHWQGEIKAFIGRLQHLEDRLARRRRRGRR